MRSRFGLDCPPRGVGGYSALAGDGRNRKARPPSYGMTVEAGRRQSVSPLIGWESYPDVVPFHDLSYPLCMFMINTRM